MSQKSTQFQHKISLCSIKLYDHTKNAGHNMAIVGEPYNIDARANILALFMIMIMLGPQLYCTHWLWLYSCLSSLIDQSIISIQGTPHTPHTHTQSQMLSSGYPTRNNELVCLAFRCFECHSILFRQFRFAISIVPSALCNCNLPFAI